MESVQRVLRSLAVLFLLVAGVAPGARAADLSGAVVLVASERLAGSPFERTVILATPLPQGGHMGFVVNRPTETKLQNLFPEQPATSRVIDPVYAGGPTLASVVFAVTRKPPANGAKALSLMPGLFAVMDGATVDRIIETTPNDARYFVGMMLWAPGELDDEVGNGSWEVRRASVETVLPARSRDLWKALSGTDV